MSSLSFGILSFGVDLGGGSVLSDFLDDTLTDAAGTALSAHVADVGGAWSVLPGSGAESLVLDGAGSAYCNGGAAQYRSAAALPGSGRYAIACDLVVRAGASGISPGPILTTGTAGQGYRFLNYAGTWYLQTLDAGTTLGTAADAIAAGNTYRMTLDYDPATSRVTGKANGKTVSGIDTTYVPAAVGVASNSAAAGSGSAGFGLANLVGSPVVTPPGFPIADACCSGPFTSGTDGAFASVLPHLDSTVELVATGTGLSVYGNMLAVGAMVVSVDGGPETPLVPPAYSSPGPIVVFSGLPDAPHPVRFRCALYPSFYFVPGADDGASTLASPLFLITGGSAPACAPPAGYSTPATYLAGVSAADPLGSPGALDHLRAEAGYAPGADGLSLPHRLLGSDHSASVARYGGQLRFYGTAGPDGTLEIWTYCDWVSFRVTVDGVMGPLVISPNLPATGRWQWLTVATGLDTGRHLFGVICSFHEDQDLALGSGTVHSVRLKGGGLDLTDRPPLRPKVGIYADSLGGGTAMGGVNYGPYQSNASYGWPLRVAERLDRALDNAAIGSTVVHDFTGSVASPPPETTVLSGEARTTDLTDLAGDPDAPDRVVVLYGTNDYGQGWAGSVPTETESEFLASYANMLAKIHLDLPAAELYCIGILPRSGSGADRLTWNADLAAAIAAAGVPQYHFLDLEGVGYEDFGRTTLDGLHPNRHGHNILTEAIVGGVTGAPTLSATPCHVYTGSVTTLALCGANCSWSGGTAYSAGAGTLGSPTNLTSRRASVAFTAPATQQDVVLTDLSTGATTVVQVLHPSFTIAPDAVAPGSTTTLTLSGENTYWGNLAGGVVPDTTFTPSAGSAGTPDFGSPARWELATVPFTAPATAQVVTLADGSTGATATIAVGTPTPTPTGTTFHRPRNNAAATVAAGRAAGAPIAVDDATPFGTTFPLIATPIRKVVVAGVATYVPLCILEVTGLDPADPSGHTLTVSGAIEGTTDVALVAGDVLAMLPTALAIAELQDAVHALEALADVAVTSVAGRTGAVTLSTVDLSDVAATAPADGQVLTWAASTSEWTPAAASAGGTPGGPADAIQTNDGAGGFAGPAHARVNAAGSLEIDGQPGEYPIEVFTADGLTTIFRVVNTTGDVFSAGAYSSGIGFRATAFGAYVGVSAANRLTFPSASPTILANPLSASQAVFGVQGAPGQTEPLVVLLDSDGNVLGRHNADGSWKPPHLADAAAAADSTYYSATQDELVYKDPGGVPRPLYTAGTPGDASFVFSQATPAATWAIAHGLGKFPSVTVVDSAGSVVVGAVAYVDSNNLTVDFAGGFSGKAYLN